MLTLGSKTFFSEQKYDKYNNRTNKKPRIFSNLSEPYIKLWAHMALHI